MRSERKETALERRLRELQNESSSLQKDIKSLSRSLRKMGTDTDTLPPPALIPDTARSRLNPNYAASIGADTTTSVTVVNQDPVPGEPETEVNLFTTSADPASPPPPIAPNASSSVLATRSDTATPATRYRRQAAPVPRGGDQRFSRYFSSGSFSRSTPLSHEKRIQRNKAIFAVLCLIVFGYVLSRAFL